jgi:hypothetical protein
MSLKRFLFPGLVFFWFWWSRSTDEVGGEQILRAASERACQLFDKIHAGAEILRNYSLDLRESGARIFREFSVSGSLVG